MIDFLKQILPLLWILSIAGAFSAGCLYGVYHFEKGYRRKKEELRKQREMCS